MKKYLIVISLFSIGLFFLSADPGIILEADRLTEEGKIEECYTLLQEGLAAADSAVEKAEMYWRLSRTMLFLAVLDKRKNVRPDELVRAYEKGAAFADEAIKLDGRSYMAYFWRASNWGSWSEIRGGFDALGKTGPMKDDLSAAVRIKPDFDAGYYVLGMLYAFLPGWPISFGNRDYAVSLVRRAVDTAGREDDILGYYAGLAAVLWERNWDRNARRDRPNGMRGEHDRKTDPAEKYCFYEGIFDFSQVPAYSTRPLSELSDREEARLLLDYAESRFPMIVKDPDEQAAFLKGLRQIKSKWR